jgi:murein DD-endopeptidase MepM/ murein hydrolase activator NlpD
MPRRRIALAFVAFAVLTTGCGAFGGGSPTPTPTLTPTVTRTPTPSATPTPTSTPTPVPAVDTPLIEIAQGYASALRVSGGGVAAAAFFDSHEYALIAVPGGFWGVIGAAADQAPGEYPLRIVLRDGAGAPLAELRATVLVYDTAFPVEYITVPPDQSGLLDPALAAQEAATRAAVFAAFTPERLWAGAFIQPVPGPVSSPYGIGRSYNGGPVGSFHHGTDFPVDEGTPVVAANAGRVAFVGALPIRGNSVIIDHGAGVFSGYHHLESAAVQPGQAVATGDLIGYSGASGLATGPHLHWEVIVNGVEVDPLFWTYAEIAP